MSITVKSTYTSFFLGAHPEKVTDFYSDDDSYEGDVSGSILDGLQVIVDALAAGSDLVVKVKSP